MRQALLRSAIVVVSFCAANAALAEDVTGAGATFPAPLYAK